MKLYLVLTLLFGFHAQASRTLPFDIDTPSKKIAEACSNKDTYAEAANCLQDRAEDLLKNEVQSEYLADLQEKVDTLELKQFDVENSLPLHELYSLYVPLSTEGSLEVICFDHENQEQIENFSRAIVISALFVERYAVNTFGRPFSPKIGFHNVAVCDLGTYEGRLMTLNMLPKTLKIGIAKEQLDVSAEDLWSTWQNGDAVNHFIGSTRLPIGQGLAFMFLSEEQKPSEFAYQNWHFLNPTGLVRSTIRTLAQQIVNGDVERLLGPTAHAVFKSTFEENQEDMDRLDISWTDAEHWLFGSKNGIEKVLEKMQEQDLIDKTVGRHLSLSRQACRGSKAVINSNRFQFGFFNFMNAKTFGIGAEIDFSFQPYDEQSPDIYENPGFCNEATLNLNDIQIGPINIYPADALSVSVVGLGPMGKALNALPKIALIQTLEQNLDQVQQAPDKSASGL